MIEGIGQNPLIPQSAGAGKAVDGAKASKDAEFAAALERAVQAGEDKKLKDACVEFEAIMLQQMIKGMRKTIDRSDLIKHTMGQEIFEEMLDESYAKEMAKSNQMGLAEILYRDLSKNLKGPLEE